MTGLWQVLGRDDIPFGEMVRLTTAMSRHGRCSRHQADAAYYSGDVPQRGLGDSAGDDRGPRSRWDGGMEGQPRELVRRCSRGVRASRWRREPPGGHPTSD